MYIHACRLQALASYPQRTGQGRFSAYSSAAVQAVQYGTAVQYGCVLYGPVLVLLYCTVRLYPYMAQEKSTIVDFWRQGTRRALVRWGRQL